VWRGCVEIAPIAAFIVPFGIAFGVAASAKGISPEISLFMSLAIYAGASQFAVLDLWHAPLPPATLALTVLAVNARHILLGAALAPWLLQIPFLGQLAALLWLSDANFAQAMSARQRGEIDAGTPFGSGITMWLIWIAGTAVGALAGSFLGDLSRFGFDAVMVAYFAAVIIGQWKGIGTSSPARLPAAWSEPGAMVDTVAAIAAVLLLTGVTMATRIGGVWIMSYVEITPRIEAFLKYMAVSVLISIVVPTTIAAAPRIWIAVAAATIVAAVTRSALSAMLVGAALAAVAKNLGM
jgi:4-azaleucine resistance transporter AzlC